MDKILGAVITLVCLNSYADTESSPASPSLIVAPRLSVEASSDALSGSITVSPDCS